LYHNFQISKMWNHSVDILRANFVSTYVQKAKNLAIMSSMCVFCTKSIKWMHTSLVMRLCQSSCVHFIFRTAGQILMKFGADIVPLEATQSLYDDCYEYDGCINFWDGSGKSTRQYTDMELWIRTTMN
jgi:hypothetical protein